MRTSSVAEKNRPSDARSFAASQPASVVLSVDTPASAAACRAPSASATESSLDRARDSSRRTVSSASAVKTRGSITTAVVTSTNRSPVLTSGAAPSGLSDSRRIATGASATSRPSALPETCHGYWRSALIAGGVQKRLRPGPNGFTKTCRRDAAAALSGRSSAHPIWTA